MSTKIDEQATATRIQELNRELVQLGRMFGECGTCRPINSAQESSKTIAQHGHLGSWESNESTLPHENPLNAQAIVSREPLESDQPEEIVKLQERIAWIQEEIRFRGHIYGRHYQEIPLGEYWVRVKKNGTKYMLCHDRVVCTQTGLRTRRR